MKLTHLQSSTEIIRSGDIAILTDPWLVDGEYYGSWYHYPPLEDPPESLQYDFIYVSHIHPDHLSHKTMARLDKSKPVVIHDFDEKFLKRNIEMLGFEVIEVPHGAPYELADGVSITIYSADNCDPEVCSKFIGCAPAETKFKFTRIDTLSVISDGTHTILNTNDCPYDLSYTTIDRVLADHGEIDLLLVGYAGAGPYPQCFTFADEMQKRAAADRKRDQFIAQAVQYLNHVRPRAYMPFAGTYVLGGRLAPLNADRGVPTLAEGLEMIEEALTTKGTGFLLNAGQTYDLSEGTCSAPYEEPSAQGLVEYLAEIANRPYDFDAVEPMSDEEILELAQRAHERFQTKAGEIGFDSETRIIVSDGAGLRFGFTASQSPKPVENLPEGYVEITLDRRLLGQLLSGPRHAHWNNAEIGSHLQFDRNPDTFERGLYYCLSWFHV